MASEPDAYEQFKDEADSLRADLTALTTDLQGLQERLDMVEALADEAVQQAQTSQGAGDGRQQSLTDQYQPGDDVSMIVEDDGSNTRHNDPMGRVDGAVTFLKTGDSTEPLSCGDEVQATVTQVDDRHMRAVVRSVGGDDGDQ
jgi:cell division septum initiation protein DivIVA